MTASDRGPADRPPTVWINGRFLSQQITGVQRYALELLRALDRVIDSESRSASFQHPSFVVLAPQSTMDLPPLRAIEIRRVGSLSGHPWEQLDLPRFAKPGILVTLTGSGPVLRGSEIFTVPDAAIYDMPQGFSMPYRTWFRAVFRIQVARAKKVLTYSIYSKERFRSILDVEASRICSIPLGCDHVAGVTPDFGVVRRNALDGQPFILGVASNNPNKNTRLLRSAASAAGALPPLVMVGSTNSTIFGSDPAASNSAGNVMDLGYVTDAELKALYLNATCFVFPSLYEGFGLPPLEAMASGCPVITTTHTSLPEVCGNAAIYCDSMDPRELSRAIQRLCGDPVLREDMRRRGIAHSAGFTWRRCAERTLAEIRALLPATGRHAPSP